MARNTLLRLSGDSSDAQRAVREVRQEVRRLGREEATARINVSAQGAEAQIERVRQRLERLSRQEATPQVKIAMARATEQLTRLELRLDRLRLKNVNVDVDVRRGALERTTAGLASVERGVQGVAKGFAGVFQQVPILGGLLTGAFSGAFSVVESLGTAVSSLVTRGISTLVGSLGSLGSLAGPIGAVAGQFVTLALSLVSVGAVAGAIVIALNAIVGAVIALGGALVALVASAAAAAAGLGALGVAFGAVLIPVVIVAIGLFTRFAAVIKARQAREQELAQAVQQQKTAEEQRKAALDQVRRAHDQLAQATVDGNHAMAQSVNDLRDAELGLESSRLGIKEARLNLLEARKALRDFRREQGLTGPSLDPLFQRAADVTTDPAQQRAAIGDIVSRGKPQTDPLELQRRILAVQQAQLGVKESINQTAHAEQTLAGATKTRADFVKRGLDAYKPYRTALAAVRQAETRLARAQDASTAAQRKYERALRGLSQTERGTLSRLNSLIAGFKSLAKAFTDPIFTALNETFDSLKGSGTGFKEALTEVGKAFGDVIRAVGSFLRESATQSAFKTLAAGAASLVRQLGAKAFTDFLRIMREIATSALPAVQSSARGVTAWLGRIAGRPAAIHRAVQAVVTQFRVWAGLAGSVARLVLALFGAAAPAGRSLASSMTRIVNRWADWIKANPEKVREFFRNAVIRARQILNGIKDVVGWLENNLPNAAKTAAAAFETTYKVVKKIVDALKFIASIPDAAPTSGKGDSPLVHGLKRALRQAFHLGFAGGGMIPGSGRGDHVPILAEPGEFMIRRAVVAQLGLPFLQALNGGGTVMPQVVPVAAGGGDTHNHFHIPTPLDATKPIDPENAAALLQQALQRRGGLLT